MKKFRHLWILVVIVWVAAAAWILLRAVPSWQAKEACLAGKGVWTGATQSCKYPDAPASPAPSPSAGPSAPAVPTDDGKPIRQPH